MILARFKDGHRELGSIWLHLIHGVMIEKNTIDVILDGHIQQFIYTTDKNAEMDYSRITAQIDSIYQFSKTRSTTTH